MLEVSDLTVRYGAVTAVKGLSLEIAEGEYVGIVGPNGAGKSSLLMAIAGDLTCAEGEVRFEGRPITGRRPEAIVRLGITLVPEGRRIFTVLTVEENLLLGASRFRGRARNGKGVARVLEVFPALERLLGTPAGRLSGGEQQQLAIGRALMAEPRLLLLDEPSLGLAPKLVDRVFEALRELHSRGQTIVLVEQFAARTLREADRAYVLRRGSIALSGRHEELKGVEDAYLGTATGERID